MSEQSLVKPGPLEVSRPGAFSLTPRSLSEALALADMMAKSDLVPKDFRHKPADCLIAVQYGMELGLSPMQSLSSIAVINGRATVWGDALLGMVLNSGLVENYKEMTTDEIIKAEKAVFWIKRKGIYEPIQREFSVDDAKRAGLWGRKNHDGSPGIWSKYWARMLQMRARSWGLRDGFADVLKGLHCREEVMDYVVTEAPAVLAMPKAIQQPEPIEQNPTAESRPADNFPPPYNPEAPPLSEEDWNNLPPSERLSDPGPAAAPAEKYPVPGDSDNYINPKQISLLWAKGFAKGLKKDQIIEIIRACGYETVHSIPKREVNAVLLAIQEG
jgi:hypothetical protein